MNKDFTSINFKIQRYDSPWRRLIKATYIDYLKHVYRILELNYQNEYVYKNTFLNEWLIKEIGKENSKVYSEFRVGTAFADLVMFNGTSKAFEIKTEYDSDSRLSLQLENYRKAFNQIFLIIPEHKLSVYKKYNENIGLITYNRDHEQKFLLEREAVSNGEVDSETIMNILYTHEYKSIVKLHYGHVPVLTSFNQYRKCYELIKAIPNRELNAYFIDQMKRRDMENVLSGRYYKEFNQLSLALKLSKVQRENLIQSLKSPIKV